MTLDNIRPLPGLEEPEKDGHILRLPTLRALRRAARVPQGAYFAGSSGTTLGLLFSHHMNPHLVWPLVAVNATVTFFEAVRICCRTYLLGRSRAESAPAQPHERHQPARHDRAA